MSAFSSKRSTLFDVLFITPLALVVMLWSLGNGSLGSWDEGLYASVAKEILKSGDWLNLRTNGSLWFDKPPLCIWMTVLFYKLFGVNELSARLFSALCGVGTVLVTYYLGRSLFNRWTGFLGSLVLLTSSHFIHRARFGMMDAPVTFFMALTLYCFWLGYSKDRFLILAGIFLGLAFMAKGFAGLLVLPIIVAYALWTGQREIFRRPAFWIGSLLALIIVLPWHLYEVIVYPNQFFRDVIAKHLWVRTQTALDGHTGGYYYYIRALINKYHPWILIGIYAAPFFIYKTLKEREESFSFITAWMLVVFCVITAIKTKLHWYMVPLYPPLSIAVGYILTKILLERHSNWVKTLFVAIAILHVPYSHIFRQEYSREIKAVAPLVLKTVPPDAVVYLYENFEIPAADFYLDRKINHLDNETAFFERAKEPRFYVLIHTAKLTPLLPRALKAGLVVRGASESFSLVARP